jgi:hypothetical protein
MIALSSCLPANRFCTQLVIIKRFTFYPCFTSVSTDSHIRFRGHRGVRVFRLHPCWRIIAPLLLRIITP